MTSTIDDLVEIDVELGPPLRQHLSGGSYYHHGPVLVAPPAGSPGAENVSSHELNHFWLHASTPYGLVLDELAELQQKATMEYCVRLYRARHAIPIAAFDVARRLLSGQLNRSLPAHGLLEQLVEQFVVPWSHDAFLERWLEGANAKAVRETRLGRTLRWIVDYEERSRAFRPDSELLAQPPSQFSDYQRRFVRTWAEALDQQPELSPAYPHTVSTDSETRPVGGSQLFEAHAQLSEETDVPFWEAAPTEARNLYWGLLAAFITKFPGKVHDTDSYLSMVGTFIAVVELALMVPIGRVYGRLRDDQMRWFDLHPGWRFGALLNTLEDDDWLTEFDEAVPRLLWRLSRRNGWKPPARFLELGAALESDDTGIARHAAACRLRLEEPDWLVVRRALPDRDCAVQFFQEHAPIMIRGATSAVPGIDVQERLNRLLEFSLAATTLMVMQRGHVDANDAFPPGLDFTNIFDNVAGPDDLKEIIYGALPFLASDAFCSVDSLV